MSQIPLRALGDTGLDVSALTYGAMSITADPEVANGVAPSLLAALDQGVNLVDTAREYPGSEALVGTTLKAWHGTRPLISTKIRPMSYDSWRFHFPLAESFTPASIRESLEASLRALDVETIDIVHLHQWHALWKYEPEWLETLRALRQEGKLRFIAVSAQDHEHDALLELIGEKLVDVVQLVVNLFESRPMNGILPLASRRGIGVIGRCVMDSGGLSGTLQREDFQQRKFLANAPYEEYVQRMEALRQAFCPDAAADMTELALRFAAYVPGVSTITLGTSTAAMVRTALDMLGKGPLSQDVMTRVRREHVWTKNFYEKLL